MIYDILYKTFMSAEPLDIRVDEMEEFIEIYDGFRYLVLLDYWWFDKVCDSIKYLISEKSDIKDSINHSFAKIRIDSYNSLFVKKILTFQFTH